MRSHPADTSPTNTLEGVTSQPINANNATSLSGAVSQPVITDAPARLPGAAVYKSALKYSGPLHSALKKTLSEENCDDSDASSLRTVDDSDGSKSLTSCESSPSKSTKSNRHVSFSASPSVYPIENLSEYNVYDPPSCFSRSGSCGERLKFFGGIDCKSFTSSPSTYVGSHADAPSAEVCKIVEPQPQLCIKSKAVITTTPLTCMVDPARKGRDEGVINNSSGNNYSFESHGDESTSGDNRYYYGVDINKAPGQNSSISGAQFSIFKTPISEQNTDTSETPESRISQIKERLSRKASPKLASEYTVSSPRVSGKIFNYDVDSSKFPSNFAQASNITLKSSDNSVVNAGSSANASGVSTGMPAGPVSPTKITTPASLISSRGAIAALARGPKTKAVKVIPIASKIKIEAPKIKTSPTSPKTSPTDSLSPNMSKGLDESGQSSSRSAASSQVQNSTPMRRSPDFDELSVSAELDESSIERICAQASAVALDIARTAPSESSCISNASSPSIDSIDTLLLKVHANLEESDGTFGLCPSSEPSMSNDVSMESIQQVSLSEELEGSNTKNVTADEMQKPKKYQKRSHYIISEESDANEETTTKAEITGEVDVSVDNEQFCITSESNGNKENGPVTGSICQTQTTSLNNSDTRSSTPRPLSHLRPGSNLLSNHGKRPGSLDSNDEGSDQSYSEAYVEALSPSEAFDVNLRCSVGERLTLNRHENDRILSSTSIPAFYDQPPTKTVLSHLSKFDHQQDSEDDVSEASFCSASPGEEKTAVAGLMSTLDKQSESVPDLQSCNSIPCEVNRRTDLKIQISASDTMNSDSLVNKQKNIDTVGALGKCADEVSIESKDSESVIEAERNASSSSADGRIQLAGGDIEICGDLDISESPSSISHSSKIASIKNELLQADSTDASEECSTASGQVLSDAESSLSEVSGNLRKDDDSDIARKSSKVSNIVSMFSEESSSKEKVPGEHTNLRNKPKTVRLRTSIPIASGTSGTEVITTKSGLGCVNTPGSNSSLLRYKKRNAFSSRKAMFEKLEKSGVPNLLTEQKSLKATLARMEGNNPPSSQGTGALKAGSSGSGSSALGSLGDSDATKSSFSNTSSIRTSSTDSEVAIAENFLPKLKKHSRKKSGVFEISSEAEKRSSSHCDSDRESPRTTASFDSDMNSLSSISTIPEQDAVRIRSTPHTLSSVERSKPSTSRLPLNKKHCDSSSIRSSKVEKAPKSNISAGKYKAEPKISLKPSNVGQKVSPRSRRRSGDNPLQALGEKRNSSSESSLCESSASDNCDKSRSKPQSSSIPCHSKISYKAENDCVAFGSRLREMRASADTSSAESIYYKNSREISIQNRSNSGKKATKSCARFTNDFGKRTTTCPSKPCESKSLKLNSSNKSRDCHRADASAAADDVKQLADRQSCSFTRTSRWEENSKTQFSDEFEESFSVQNSNYSPKLVELDSCSSSKASSLPPCDLDSNLKTDVPSASSKKLPTKLISSVSDTSDDCELKQLIEHLEKEHDELEHRSRVVAAAALRKKSSTSKPRKTPRVQKLISQFETK